jgi:asparagine synthase (glutamine-hydrolysing)
MLAQRSEETMYRNLISNWEDPSIVVPGSSEPVTAFTDPSAWAKVPTLIEKMMYLDAITYLCDDILVKLDRATMAVSLEGRCPLLDYRIFEFAWRIPLSSKAGNGFGKLPLREILYRYVPRELVDRPKAGFTIPIGDWLRGPMRDWAEALLSPARVKQDGLFAPEPIARTWAEHLAGSDRTQQLWSVLMFQAWQETATRSASESAACELAARPQ